MTPVAGGHPSDADRAEASLPALTAVIDAARARDAAALATLYRDDVVWLAPDGAHTGVDAAVTRHMEIAARASSWDPPQQHGARAALRWTGDDGSRGAIVVEVRRGLIISAASL